MKIVVLGVGNLILTDEGVGVQAIHEIERRYVLPDYVEVVDGGTSGMECIGQLTNADHVIILDAVKTGNPPGSVVVLQGEEVPKLFRMKMFMHQVTLADVLATLEFSGEPPKNLMVIGVEPVSLEQSMELTPQVAAQLPVIVNMAMDELRRLGVDVQEA